MAKVPYSFVDEVPTKARQQLYRNFEEINRSIGGAFAAPIGVVLPWAGKNGLDSPLGWLVCNGASYSVHSYPLLFEIIGYEFGGAGEVFNVPNLSDRFIRGTHLGSEVGDVGGSLASNMPSHGHGFVQQGHHGHNFAANTPHVHHTEPPNHGHAGTTGDFDRNHSHVNSAVVFMNCSATHGHGGGCGQLAESPSYGGCTGFGCNHTSNGANTGHLHGFNTAGVSSGLWHNHGIDSHGHNFVAEGNHNHGFVSEGGGADNQPPYMDFRFIIRAE